MHNSYCAGIKIAMSYTVSPEQLDRIYHNWAVARNSRPFLTVWMRSYAKVARGSAIAQQFENWVFEQGGEIYQLNKKRYIKFNSIENYTAFLLVNA